MLVRCSYMGFEQAHICAVPLLQLPNAQRGLAAVEGIMVIFIRARMDIPIGVLTAPGIGSMEPVSFLPFPRVYRSL